MLDICIVTYNAAKLDTDRLHEEIAAQTPEAHEVHVFHNTSMTLNPDLVFGAPVAVADVKYKTATDEWRRGDLYQVVTFATGYRVSHAAILEFARSDSRALPDLVVGDVCVRQIVWPADPDMIPVDAAASLIASVRTWLSDAALLTRLPESPALQDFSER